MKKTVRLAQAVLASSFFVAGVVQATDLKAQYDVPPNDPLLTSKAANIQIFSNGKVNATAGDGITIDSPKPTIIIDAANTTAGNNAIVVSGAGNGIKIKNDAGKNIDSIITIGAGSNILTTGDGSGIYIDDATTTITNNGGIFGGASGIYIGPGGVDAKITNDGSAATIQGGGFKAGSPSILVAGNVPNGGTGLTLSNTNGAKIVATASNDAIQINQNFTSITNGAGSFITSINGRGINLGPNEVAPITGDVANYGTITATGTGSALKVTNAFNGVINNNVGGILQNTSNSAAGGVVVLNDSFNTFNNFGTIQETGNAGFMNAILISDNAPGTINNSGLIQTTNESSTIYILGDLTGFNNTGSIIGSPSIVGQGVLYAPGNNIDFANGFVNSGTITSKTAANAINFQAGLNNIIPYFQQGGTVTGNVLLSSNSSTVNPAQYALTMSGGTINGNVTSSGTNASLLQLNGGTIAGTTTLGNVAGNIVNLNGTKLAALVGGTNTDTFNLSGGSFTSLDGGGGNNTINVTGSFTQTGPIGATTPVQTINVQNNGYFTVNQQITGATVFNILSGGSMATNFNPLNGSAGATINISANGSLAVNSGSTFTATTANNSGTLSIQPGGKLVLTDYTETGLGTYSPGIGSAASFGILQTTNTATFDPGSKMNPFLNTGGVFLPAGTFFPVVQATGGVVAALGDPTLVIPETALVFFEQDVNPNDITITLRMNTMASVAQGDNAQSIGAALDPLLFGGTTNPELLAVLGQAQLFPDSYTLTQELLELVPSLNYALPSSSRIAMDASLDAVQIHLEQLHGFGPPAQEEEYREIRNYELYNGVSYGDRNVIAFGTTRFRSWAHVNGTILDQHKRDQIEGFKSELVGVAVGSDWRLTNEALVGAALSYNKVTTLDYTTAQNKVETESYQATVYGWFQPWESIYFDTMLAAASHNYDTLRNIQFGNFPANASATFLGMQYGVQTDVGYAFGTQENWYVSPYARFRYTYLDIGKYTEKGAGGINLSVKNEPIDEMIGGLGIRIAAMRDYVQAVYVPEVSATLLYDFAGTAQALQSSFLGGGGTFYISSVKPQQLIQLYSLGVTSYTSDGYVAQLKFSFEHREQLFGYNAFLQLSYQWD